MRLPLALHRAAKSPSNMPHQNGSRIAKAGVCVSSSAGSTHVLRFGITLWNLAYQRQPPYFSSSSYTP